MNVELRKKNLATVTKKAVETLKKLEGVRDELKYEVKKVNNRKKA